MAAKVPSDKEIGYLKGLDCIDDVKGQSIVWNTAFKAHVRTRLTRGDMPSAIFREAGCVPELIGPKRIERLRQMEGGANRRHRVHPAAIRVSVAMPRLRENAQACFH